MKKYVLKLSALGIAAGLVFGFAACGNEVTEGNTTSETSTEAVAALEPASVAETESVPETETETPTQAEPDSKTDGGSSDGGQDDYQSGASDDSGSGHQNGSGSGSGQTPQPDPAPTPNPDFDPDTVIEMVREKVNSNEALTWDSEATMNNYGWVELPAFESTRTIESIANGIYECILGEHDRNPIQPNKFFNAIYLGKNENGDHRFVLCRG